MQALTFHGIETLRHESVSDPRLERPDDVIVRVGAAGICGSDLHVYHGRETGLDLGTVMGHEFAGEVTAVGSEITAWRPGDRVVSPFSTSCGRCRSCVSGLTARCEQGQLFGWVEGGEGLHGGQAELVRVPLADSTLVAVPREMSLETALFVGDILATGYFGAESAAASDGGTLAVLGCGPVGLMAVLAARELGAARVYAVDQLTERLELAESFGASPIQLGDGRLARLGDEVDGVIEAVGSAAATRLAVDLVRPGGTIAALGVHTEEHFPFAPAEAYDKNLTYRAGRCPVRRYMERVLPLATRRQRELAAVISHRLPLADGVRGYDIFARRLERCTKVVLLPG